ncbi:tagatose-6-phosphate kinase [Lactococcus garvieae]|uniref:Tagatose-6-phosphate kinase n=1 Tax=Lactococcus garvieae DCC43 TaxID=1231377 RepID=K2PUX4_9LACT|nr:tagatose-6-phosphate kinase [Lactococcus garvieae]EKF51246.1 Tagatose-6-phosphate kinase [Lactococcus garvieae DCC43]
MSILTVTLNPAIDISYPLETFHLNTVNRVAQARKTAGGKGLNVSRVLKELGADVLATGFADDILGAEIIENLKSDGIESQFTKISGKTRNCIAILHEGQQTEILEKGPRILKEEAEHFIHNFEEIVAKVDVITISGSLPEGLPENFYSELIKIANKQDKKVVLDCSGKALEAVLKSNYKPHLIKPNLDELSDLLGKEVTLENIEDSLKDKLFEGIEWIVVSLGKDGAFAKVSDKFYRVKIPKIEVVNPVGSGDSTVAGLAYGISRHESIEVTLKRANVCGMLNAQEAKTGHIDMANYQALFEQLKVEKI